MMSATMWYFAPSTCASERLAGKNTIKNSGSKPLRITSWISYWLTV